MSLIAANSPCPDTTAPSAPTNLTVTSTATTSVSLLWSPSLDNGLWHALYAAGADVVLNGHDYDYERFAPPEPERRGRREGIREFVVGTGGVSHYSSRRRTTAPERIVGCWAVSRH